MINYDCKHSGIIDELERKGHYLRKEGAVLVSSNDAEVQAIIDSFDHVAYLRPLALDRIKTQAESVMQNVVNSYPEFERLTWQYQRAEIELWRQDNAALTPNIDTIAANRGVDREVQLAKVDVKTKEFESICNTLAGKRQYYSDVIKSSVDIDYLLSFNFEV